MKNAGAMPMKPKATVRLHVPKDLMKAHPPNPKHQVGKHAMLSVHGTILSVSQDQYGHSVEVELGEPKKDREGMKEDMKEMKKQHTIGYSGAE